MRHPDIDMMMVMERRRDELAEAERHRLYLEARAAQSEKHAVMLHLSLRPFVIALARSLSFLGDRMLNWSCRLQYRYQMANGAANQQAPCR